MMKLEYKEAAEAIKAANKIIIIQAENPDGDSMASSAALESLLPDQDIVMFCMMGVPGHLHYIEGWDRVVTELPNDADLFIIVDTSSAELLEKTLLTAAGTQLKNKPVIVIDHHPMEATLDFEYISLIDPAASSTSHVIYNFAVDQKIDINLPAAEAIVQSLMADSRGLTNNAVTVSAIDMLARLVELGVDLARLEDRRHEKSRKSQRIFDYKGDLIKRVEFLLEGRLAILVIPWEEIEEYSYEYNPSVLVVSEMRQVEGVDIAIVFKTYPDGKITAKLRSNTGADICSDLAKSFDGGGHPNAAGMKVYDKDFAKVKDSVIKRTEELLDAPA